MEDGGLTNATDKSNVGREAQDGKCNTIQTKGVDWPKADGLGQSPLRTVAMKGRR